MPISVEIPSASRSPARLDEGVTVVEANPKHAVGRAFFELADRLRKGSSTSKPTAPAKRSLFKRG